MGIFDFLKPKKISDRYAISLDIGTEFVKALIFKVVDDKAEVVGVGTPVLLVGCTERELNPS